MRRVHNLQWRGFNITEKYSNLCKEYILYSEGDPTLLKNILTYAKSTYFTGNGNWPCWITGQPMQRVHSLQWRGSNITEKYSNLCKDYIIYSEEDLAGLNNRTNYTKSTYLLKGDSFNHYCSKLLFCRKYNVLSILTPSSPYQQCYIPNIKLTCSKFNLT